MPISIFMWHKRVDLKEIKSTVEPPVSQHPRDHIQVFAYGWCPLQCLYVAVR